MNPLQDTASIVARADQLAGMLTKRAARAMEEKGVDAAWELILSVIRDESQYLHEANPVALVMYGRYVHMAAMFLHTFADKTKALALSEQIDEDLLAFEKMFTAVTGKNVACGEYPMVSEALDGIAQTLQALYAQFLS